MVNIFMFCQLLLLQTDKEIQRYLKGAYPGEPSDIVFTYNGDISKFPAEVDWRKKGYVTPVKNQVDLT